MKSDECKVFWIWMAVAFVGVQVMVGTLFLAVFAAIVRALTTDAIRQVTVLLGR